MALFAVMLGALVALAPVPAAAGPNAAYGCLGDCDRDRVVTVDEILRGVRIALDLAPVSSCPNGGPGSCPGGENGLPIGALIGAVRNALQGCTVTRDFSDFERFTYSLRPDNLGFCPEPDVVASLSLIPVDGGLVFVRSRVRAADPRPAACDDDGYQPECYALERDSCRRLTSDEIASVRDVFAPVTTWPESDASCLQTFEDECRVATFNWDGETVEDLSHATNRIAFDERGRLLAVLDSLGAGAEVPCPLTAPGRWQATADVAINLQTQAIPIALAASGTVVVHTGAAAPAGDEGAVGAQLTALALPPISFPGLSCLCLELNSWTEEWPPTLRGTIACGETATAVTSVRAQRDHNIEPGRPGNSGGLPDDATCRAPVPSPFGGASLPCREGVDADCRGESSLHADVCNSALITDTVAAAAPRGTAVLPATVSLRFLRDNGACAPAPAPAAPGDCRFSDYGADCVPCTADDTAPRRDELLVLTTGVAEGVLYDANNQQGVVIGAGHDCFGVPCDTVRTGAPIDCDALTAASSSGFAGTLVGALPLIDIHNIGDGVLTLQLTTR